MSNGKGDKEYKYLNIPLSGRLRKNTDGTQLGEGDFQTLTNMRYGELSPKSIAGMTKINTSVINATYLMSRQGFHFRKSTPTDYGAHGGIGGGGEEEYDFTPPNPSALWAWFKHDEGSGTTIIDYSAIDTDGALVNNSAVTPSSAQQTYFWGTNAGYGTQTAAGLGAMTLRASPAADPGYCSMVAFIKPLGYGMFDSTQAVQLGHTSNLNCLIVGWDGASSPHYWKFNYSAGQKTGALSVTYGTWYCIYAYSQRGTNNNGLYYRVDGDADWTAVLTNQGAATGDSGTQSSVFMFGVSTNPTAMVGGDGLYYCSTASTGIITPAQATIIYNALKARYGMS